MSRDVQQGYGHPVVQTRVKIRTTVCQLDGIHTCKSVVIYSQITMRKQILNDGG